ncbi:MAG: hypothetical protein LIP16_15405 [Clostridium sp.]|nr:hypothetical protein [Clostridium sp.]
MKKILAFAMILALSLSLAACGGKDEPKPSGDDSPGQQTEQPGNTPDDDNGAVSVPDGVAIPTDKYPYLKSLVLPDNAAVTEVDDTGYEAGAMVSMIVKPMDKEKVAAYLEKLKTEGYTEGDNCLVSPDGNLELAVDDMMLELGYISLAAFDRSDGGTPSGNGAPDGNSETEKEVAAYLEGLGFTVQDVTPEKGFQSFGIRTYTEYDGEVQVIVEEQTAEQQHAFYQQLTARSRTLSEDGELHDPSNYDTVLEDDTVEDFATGAWTTGWAYRRSGYQFSVTFYYYPAGSGGGYIIGFGATQQ